MIFEHFLALSYNIFNGPGSSSSKALGYGLDGPDSSLVVGGVEIFFPFRLVLETTQPPVK